MAYCYFQGKCIEEKDANLPIHLLGVQRGFGIFDLFRTRNRVPTFLEDHLVRFQNSQQFLSLKQLISREEITRAVEKLQSKNQFANATFKLMLLAGGNEMDDMLEPFFFIINTPLDVESLPKTGSLITHEYVREYPAIKSINYFTSNLLHQKKKSMGAVDVLYHRKGIISEASRSNVFVVKEGTISTPEKDILAGITRQHILKIAEKDFKVEVRDVSVAELMDADEVFISSTLKEVMPILKIDDKVLGGGSGSITEKLQNDFQSYLMSI